MADPATAFESWEDNAAWDTVVLGDVFLPGVCSIEDFEFGQDIEVQKRRKKEKAKIRDNGLAPCSFTINVRITQAELAQWVQALPRIQPRRAGAVRQPLRIEHPLPNMHGVTEVYVHKIKPGMPSARKGMSIDIKVAEWFEEEKDAKPSKTVKNEPPKKPRPLIQYPTATKGKTFQILPKSFEENAFE